MPEKIDVGQIWKEKATKKEKCYVLYRDEKRMQVQTLYPDGYVFTWNIEAFERHHEYTGDHVPFEDIKAILF